MSSKREIVLKQFGLHVKNIRLSKSLTQIDVSSAMGWDQQSLHRVESGNVNPSLIYLLDLSKALDIDAKELITFKTSATKKKKN